MDTPSPRSAVAPRGPARATAIGAATGRTIRALGLPGVVLAALLVALPALARDHDRWFVILLDGQPCGWSREQVTADGEVVLTRSETRMSIRRGEDLIRVEMESEFHETPRGEPISARSVRSVGSGPMVREIEWTDQGIIVRRSEGDRTSQERRSPFEGDWLTPAAAAEFVRARLAAGARSIEYRTIDPAGGADLVRVVMTGFEPDGVEVLGRQIEGVRCDVVSSASPGMVVQTWLDSSGRTLRTQIPFGGLSLATVLSDRATALREVEAPELMVQTLIRPNRPIREPRRVTIGRYVLIAPDDRALAGLPETSVQRVEPLGGGRARVIVQMSAPTAAEPDDTAPYLAPSSMIDSADPEIIALARRATAGSGADRAARAEALRRAVFRHITDKSLGVGFASASEACRTRAGDCSEHAVLLAAVLRAEGIPARVVSGLVYADEFLGSRDVFGFHMWTQALIDHDDGPRWIDLDATLPRGTPFDATHIALVVSALGDDASAGDMTSIAALLGALRVDVEHTGR